MIVIDSSGWIEYLVDGPSANRYERYLNVPAEVLTPTIVVYEVYKHSKRLAGEEAAVEALGLLYKTCMIELDEELALMAADVSLEHRLPMADAIVYATARLHDATLITSDADFRDLPGVTFIPK